MSNDVKDIVVPILQEIQTDLSALRSDVAVLKESVSRIDARVGAMDNYMAGFHSNLNWNGTAIDELRGRVEALENPDTD